MSDPAGLADVIALPTGPGEFHAQRAAEYGLKAEAAQERADWCRRMAAWHDSQTPG